MMETTKKGTSDLSQQKLTAEIRRNFNTSNMTEKECVQLSFGSSTAQNIENVRPSIGKSEKVHLLNKSLQSRANVVVPTYDLMEAGPRNRFTIISDKGPMIVHNCGYGLGPGEITQDEEGNVVKTGLLGYADAMGIELSQEFAIKAVEIFRRSYPEIQQYWYDLHRAAVQAIEHDSIVELGCVILEMKGRVLCIKLPSGRSLHYINPSVNWEEAVSKKGHKYKRANITCDGVDAKTHQWATIETRGTKLFENIIQAICRDVLCEGIMNATEAGFDIVLHVHDELVAEVPEDSPLGVPELVECMTRKISWAAGLILGAEGFQSYVYKKE